jgi:hypothetical protein
MDDQQRRGLSDLEADVATPPNVEWIARCRLRIGARKWLMSKLALKKYRRQAP